MQQDQISQHENSSSTAIIGLSNTSHRYVVINADELRLRIEPSLDSDTFKWKDGTNQHPKKGEKYLYLGEYGDFYKIDFKGHTLWVSKQYTFIEE